MHYTQLASILVVISTVSGLSVSKSVASNIDKRQTAGISNPGFTCGSDTFSQEVVGKAAERSCTLQANPDLDDFFTLRRFPRNFKPKPDQGEFTGVEGEQHIFPVFKDGDVFQNNRLSGSIRVVTTGLDTTNCTVIGLVKEEIKVDADVDFNASATDVDLDSDLDVGKKFTKCEPLTQ
ncbi:BgtE-5996 [Blumeria graminis f. sp. tritici]|uniref:BgtE-5996 n=2 Tax=Blumeria graminis f. sp. tritici TaxID=62690 RepID=A0A061HHX5_BLUGR|nr:putative secreted effector protein [Blumeria graminis f. sp. tritici 96224]VDB90358.1 BgtE-5996 [Blumeria graminis f. sp. tritici]